MQGDQALCLGGDARRHLDEQHVKGQKCHHGQQQPPVRPAKGIDHPRASKQGAGRTNGHVSGPPTQHFGQPLALEQVLEQTWRWHDGEQKAQAFKESGEQQGRWRLGRRTQGTGQRQEHHP